MATESRDVPSRLLPYVPSLLLAWDPTGPDPRHMRVAGTLVFVDISGFTRLTERLSRKGKVGAEEMSDILDATFAALLQDAVAEGGDLLKWGGDAVLLLFSGSEHAPRAARAAHRMRSTLRQVGRIPTSSGTVVLRMSVGVDSGDVDLFLVGDPGLHRELLVCGPVASTTAATESAAAAGQIGLSAATAALLPSRALGAPLLDGRLLHRLPEPAPVPPSERRRALGIAPEETLSAPLREHLSHRTGDAEHRGITVAFVQFAGTDDLLEREGPTALSDALEHVVTTVQRACAEHGVTFFESDINRDGGKIMLTAGAPRSAENLEERMLRVARQVVEGGGRLPLRVGINQGHVFAGDFGPAFRRTYSVKGDAINLAARLLGRAEPGQALATLRVLEHSPTAFATEALPPFTVKGKAHPVHAAVVGPVLGTRQDDDLDVGLVGRADELHALTAALDGLGDGRGGTVRVVGEAGIGKSRLVAELVRECAARVIETRCEGYESATTYFPFRRVLREVLQLPVDDLDGVRVVERVRALSPELVPWAPLLGLVLDVPLDATPETAELDPQFRPARLATLVVDLITVAIPGSVVLVVEDSHHLDDASGELLQRLGDAALTRPWLLVVTSREEPSTESGDVLRLGPLSEPESVELARAVSRERPLTPHVLDVLARRSGGNPMFLGAMLRTTRLSGDLAELPDTVEALVAGDIDGLTADDRRALRCAAVLGTVVDVDALDLVLAEHGGIDATRLRRLDRFLVRGRSGRLRFRNALLRDVAYEGLPFRRRRELHDRVGSAIERDAADPTSLAETLSLHFFHAGNHAKSWHYSVVAGTRAADKHAHGTAVTFFDRAAAAVPRDGSVAPSSHAAVLEQLADSRFLIGDSERASAAYAAARRLLHDDPVRQASLVAKEVRIDVRRRRFPQAMRRLSQGLHRLDGLEGREAEAARSLLARRYAYNRYAQGRIDDALVWAEVAGRHAEESADKVALAQAYEMLNGIYAGSGRPEPLPYGRLALQANRELGDLPRQGHCLNNLAVEAFTHGRWEEALVQYRQAADIFRRCGDYASEGNAAFNQAELLVRQGRFVEAAALLPEVLLVARAVQDEELVALALREQAQTLAATGDLAGGMALLEEARDHFERLGEESELLVTDLVRVEALVRAGRAAAAGRVLAEAVPAGDRAQLAGLTARWHRLSALVHRSHGGLEEARREVLAGLEAAAAEQDLFEQALLLRDLVVLSQLQGQPVDETTLRRASELLDAMGVVS